MPTITSIDNVFNPTDNGLGATLQSLGNSMWGPHAATAAYAREKTRGARRENDSRENLINSARASGGILDYKNPNVGADLLGVENANNIAAGNRMVTAGRYGAADPRTDAAVVGAGGAYHGTAQGVQGGYDNQRRIEEYRVNHNLVDTYDPVRGITVKTPQMNAAGAQVTPTVESLKAGMLQQVLRPGAPGGAAPASFPGAPVAADPTANMTPLQRKLVGMDMPQKSYINATTGQIGTSDNGGMTIQLTDGRVVAPTGFQPVGDEAALQQARGNNMSAASSTPLVVADPTKSQAYADAQRATGLGAWAQKSANAELGSIPFVSSIVKAVTGSPEIAPETQHAQSRLDVLNGQARAAWAGGTGRQTDAARADFERKLPQGAAFANSTTEANKIGDVVNALAADHESQRQIANNPNNPSAERASAFARMHTLEQAIRGFTAPAQGAAPAAPPPPAPAPAPAPAAPQAASDPISQARAAIAQNVPREVVIQRLQQNGIQPPPDL